ncbi:MAG TPA: hypothetical protein VGH53_02720 [Streptosporangiaceae bacterium]
MATTSSVHICRKAYPPPPRRLTNVRLSEYFKRNISITASGHFCTSSLLAAIAVHGEDRVMLPA